MNQSYFKIFWGNLFQIKFNHSKMNLKIIIKYPPLTRLYYFSGPRAPVFHLLIFNPCPVLTNVTGSTIPTFLSNEVYLRVTCFKIKSKVQPRLQWRFHPMYFKRFLRVELPFNYIIDHQSTISIAFPRLSLMVSYLGVWMICL